MRKNDKKGNCSGKRTKRSGEEGRERGAAGCNPPNTTAQTRERGKEGRGRGKKRAERGEREGSERRAAGCNPPNTTAEARERGKEGRAKQETRIGKRRGEREGKGGHRAGRWSMAGAVVSGGLFWRR